MTWDLDIVVHEAQKYPALNAKTTNGMQITLTKDYINKLDEIRKSISQQSGIYPKFLISSSDIVNAGATWQNGQPVTIFTLGILNKIGQDYDALAAVVSHEYSHLTLRHMQSQQTANAVVDILAGLAIMAIDSSYGGSARNPYRGLYQTGLDLTSNLAKSSYSRSEEIEADVQGVKYMMAAGYSAEGAIRLQQNLIPSDSSFFSTHPSSDTRVESIRTAMNSSPYYKKDDGRTAIAYNSNNLQNTTTSYVDTTNLDSYKKTCEDIGFKPRTSRFDDCIFKFSGKRIVSEALPNEKSNMTSSADDNFYITCEDIGFKPKTKKFKECLARLKGEPVSQDYKLAGTSKANLPDKGQVGSIISVQSKDSSVIFSSSVQTEIPKGTKVKILTDGSHISGTINKYYDGYYSASVEKIDSIKLGSKVIILN
jgi:predicted Zn-dependent protease